MPREFLEQWQWQRLSHAIGYARQRSAFWRERIPSGIGSMAEYFDRVPLLLKPDIIAAQQLNPPYGSLPSLDPRLGIRHHQTSGTSGAPPVRTFDTARDWAWGADLWATALYGMGVRSAHRGMVAFGYGLFIGFWGMHYGLERMGCTVVPAGGLDSKARVDLLVDHQIEVLGTTPSYAQRLMHTAREMGVDLAKQANVQIIMAGAEPRPRSTTEAISAAFGARVFNAAGTTEFGTISMFECQQQNGGCHIIESGVIDEVLDPRTLRPVAYGEQGVRVTTGLGREGLQLFRHWTDDYVIRRPYHECGCGRTWDWYEGGILGRSDDMRKVRGISITPVMIEDVLRGFPEVIDFRTVLRTVDGLDTVIITIEAAADGQRDAAGVCDRVGAEIKRKIGIRALVGLATESLPKFELKAARFHDERNG
jgi:phenylacetate-coenzyme A ligase PaaK-like adenylate-forming protein